MNNKYKISLAGSIVAFGKMLVLLSQGQFGLGLFSAIITFTVLIAYIFIADKANSKS